MTKPLASQMVLLSFDEGYGWALAVLQMPYIKHEEKLRLKQELEKGEVGAKSAL